LPRMANSLNSLSSDMGTSAHRIARDAEPGY
jgi:hypothetical protein